MATAENQKFAEIGQHLVSCSLFTLGLFSLSQEGVAIANPPVLFYLYISKLRAFAGASLTMHPITRPNSCLTSSLWWIDLWIVNNNYKKNYPSPRPLLHSCKVHGLKSRSSFTDYDNSLFWMSMWWTVPLFWWDDTIDFRKQPHKNIPCSRWSAYIHIQSSTSLQPTILHGGKPWQYQLFCDVHAHQTMASRRNHKEGIQGSDIGRSESASTVYGKCTQA